MNPTTVATIHSSTPIDSIDIRYVAHLDQVELAFWSRGRLVQVLALPTEHAVSLAGQLHGCTRAAELEAEVAFDG